MGQGTKGKRRKRQSPKGETNGLQAMLSVSLLVSLFGSHFSKRLALRISKIFGMELDNDK